MRDSLDIEALHKDWLKERSRRRRVWIVAGVSFVAILVINEVLPTLLDRIIESTLPTVVVFGLRMLFVLGLYVGLIVGLKYVSYRHMYQRLGSIQSNTFFGSQPRPYGFAPVMTDVFQHFVGISIILAILAGVVLLIPLGAFLAPLLFFGTIFLFPRIIHQYVLRPIARGRHDLALSRNRRVRALLPFLTRQSLINEALFLQSMGESEKGMAVSKEIIAWACKKPRLEVLSLGLNNIAYQMILDGEFETSLSLIEAAVRLDPSKAHILDTLATWYLEQQIYPERALELTNRIKQVDKSERARFILLSREAYVYALQGQQGLTNETLTQFYSVSETSIETSRNIADAYYYAGKAEQKIGDTANARRNFERVFSLEPTGAFGKLARQELQEMGIQPEA